MRLRHSAVVAHLTAAAPLGASEAQQRGPTVSAEEYDGWRQYSVHCARCHGQDVTGNPVAASLLVSARAGGPVADEKAFVNVVAEGRAAKGIPAFNGVMQLERIHAVYAYVKGRADGRI